MSISPFPSNLSPSSLRIVAYTYINYIKIIAKQWPTPIELSLPANVVLRHTIAYSKGKIIGNSFRLFDLFLFIHPFNALELTTIVFYRHRAASCHRNSAAIAALFEHGECRNHRI